MKKVSCLKQGSQLNGSGFEGLGGTPTPKLHLSAPPPGGGVKETHFKYRKIPKISPSIYKPLQI